MKLKLWRSGDQAATPAGSAEAKSGSKDNGHKHDHSHKHRDGHRHDAHGAHEEQLDDKPVPELVPGSFAETMILRSLDHASAGRTLEDVTADGIAYSGVFANGVFEGTIGYGGLPDTPEMEQALDRLRDRYQAAVAAGEEKPVLHPPNSLHGMLLFYRNLKPHCANRMCAGKTQPATGGEGYDVHYTGSYAGASLTGTFAFGGYPGSPEAARALRIAESRLAAGPPEALEDPALETQLEELAAAKAQKERYALRTLELLGEKLLQADEARPSAGQADASAAAPRQDIIQSRAGGSWRSEVPLPAASGAASVRPDSPETAQRIHDLTAENASIDWLTAKAEKLLGEVLLSADGTGGTANAPVTDTPLRSVPSAPAESTTAADPAASRAPDEAVPVTGERPAPTGEVRNTFADSGFQPDSWRATGKLVGSILLEQGRRSAKGAFAAARSRLERNRPVIAARARAAAKLAGGQAATYLRKGADALVRL